jgi:hypothetical protein
MAYHSQILTGLKDVDIKILSNLDDDTLEIVCLTDQYVSTLCHDTKLWYLKIVTMYNDFPALQSLSPMTWKNLYYNLKDQDWTTLMIGIDENNRELIDWIMKQGTYVKFFIHEFIQLITKYNNQRTARGKENVLVKFFKFLYTHRLFISERAMFNKK